MSYLTHLRILVGEGCVREALRASEGDPVAQHYIETHFMRFLLGSSVCSLPNFYPKYVPIFSDRKKGGNGYGYRRILYGTAKRYDGRHVQRPPDPMATMIGFGCGSHIRHGNGYGDGSCNGSGCGNSNTR